MGENFVRAHGTFRDDISKPVKGVEDSFKRLQKTGGKGFAIGAGAAVTAKGFSLLDRAVSSTIGFLGDAKDAAIEDEKSIQTLGTALQSNVKDWDGNTDAIEKTIKARMLLGFADDEQRASLAKLVAATKDVNKALELERTAMDLARAKGVSLADASQALIDIEGGRYRALGKLIGSVKEIKTEEEALAAVRKVAGRAAIDYANTTEGKSLTAQVLFNEKMEDLGYRILPMVNTGLDLVTGHAGQLAGIDENISTQLTEGTLKQLVQTRDALRAGLNDLSALPGQNDFLAKVVAGSQVDNLRSQLAAVNKMIDQFGDRSTTAAERAKGAFGTVVAAAAPVVGASDAVGDAADDMGDDVTKAASKVVTSWADMKKATVADADSMIANVYGPIIDADRLAATEAEIAAQKRIIASDKSSAAEKRDARSRLHDLQQDNAEYLVSLAEAGQTGTKAYAKGITELKDEIKKAKGPAKAALQEILAKILEVEEAGKVVPINVIVKAQTSQWAKNLAGNLRADGGPVSANKAYIVGEKGPEWFVPDSKGTILPNGRSPFGKAGSLGSMAMTPMAAGGGPTLVLAVTVQPSPGMSPAEAQMWGRQLASPIADEFARRKLIPRQPWWG